MFRFTLKKWSAWAPGLHAPSAWRNWAQAPHTPIPDETAAIPSPAFLPPMQRRRLGCLARMAFHCAWPLAENQRPMPVVYGSRHGETTRSIDLLLDLARQAPLSPTSFGLSVHNAVVGQWSITRQETTETVAISAETAGAEHSFLEACSLFTQGHTSALVILAEEHPPHLYAPWIADAPFSYAAAFHLQPGDDWCLTLETSDPDQACSELPSALNLLRHLALGATHWQHQEGRQVWTWKHRDH